MNKKVKIVATTAIASMLLAGCGEAEPVSKEPPTMTAGIPAFEMPPGVSKQSDPDDFVRVDPPVDSENAETVTGDNE
ncbi:MAG: hypothetical protein E7473_09015 [Ruminococcaceae bacterium]|nr:hypothetical protein [Oscillospiraceae bacterium]